MKMFFRVFLCCSVCCLFISSACKISPADAQQTPLVLNSDVMPPLHLPNQNGYLDQVIKEVFKRIGKEVIIQSVPTERALINANEGIDDGLDMRVGGLSKIYPNLMEVPEKIYDLEFVVFTKKADFQPTGWESLKPYDVGIVNGYKILENNITGVRSLSKVANIALLFTLLEKDRADLVVVIKIFGLETIKTRGFKGIKVLEPPLAVKECFMYLHKKHEDIIPKLTGALKDMKKDGTYSQLLGQ